MTPDEIELELHIRRKSINMTKIAKSLDPPCSRQAVSQVIKRQSKSIRVARAIADALHRDVKYVFPEYFMDIGNKYTAKRRS